MNRKQFLATIIGLPAAIKAVLTTKKVNPKAVELMEYMNSIQYKNNLSTNYKLHKGRWPHQDEIYPGIPHEPFHVKLDKDWLLEGRIVGKRSTIALNELLDKFVKGQ